MPTRRDGGADRGQVIIVAALVVAATFVGLALVLNSGIYAENLSSRETTGSDGALVFAQEAQHAIADGYGLANAANASKATEVRDPFTDAVDNWSAARERRDAASGRATDVERTPHVGWRLEQSGRRSFTNATDPDAADWQVVHGAGNVSVFEMNVTRAELYDASSDFEGTDDDSFTVRVDDGDTSWTLFIFRDSANGSIVVHEGDPNSHADLGDLRTSSSSCVHDDDSAIVDFRAEELGGTPCDVLNFSDDLSGSVDVYYQNVRDGDGGSELVNGTYTLVVNGSVAIDDADFNDPNGDAPTAQAIIYSATYTTYYARSDGRFVRDGRYMVRDESYAG